ncbi:MAG TPA: hypothetical protein PKM73_17490, partial [Verrucomicrobiota bacterium]|nr:hypothetical protein [Verrucomicrobiota bacterium]
MALEHGDEAGLNGCRCEAAAGDERCNGADDDCDGATDEGDPGAGVDCETGEPGVCGPGTTVCA